MIDATKEHGDDGLLSATISNTEMVATKYGNTLTIREVKDVNQGSEYFLDEQQLANLVNNAPSLRDKVIIELMAYCGLRRDEVRSLKIEEVDFENGWLNLTTTKRGKKRTVPVRKDVLRDLEWQRGQRRTGWMFESREGARLNNCQLNRMLDAAGSRAGIRNPNPKRRHINPHLLRHSFARLFLRKGGRIEVLQKLLGHESITTTVGVYGKPSMKDITDEYRRLVG